MIPLKDSHPSGIFPFWTLAIIATNIYFFFIEITSINPDAFINQYALIPSLVNLNDLSSLYPFVTSQFLHAGFLHIISNMLFLWVFGDNVEAKFGILLFPLIYLLSGVVGGFSQYILSPTSDIPMLGASGAVAGILGAYLVFFPHHSVKTLIPIFGFVSIVDIPATMMLIYWIVTQLFAGAFSLPGISESVGGVAYFAHIGGFVTGFIAAKLISISGPQRLEAV